MSDPNERQIGGDHYATKQGPQHWDYAIQVLDNRYLEGNITKYVARHRRKNGRQDLEKALHYLDKLRSAYDSRLVFRPDLMSNDKKKIVAEFCDSAKLNMDEEGVMVMCAEWVSTASLDIIQHYINNLMSAQLDRDRSLEARKAGATVGGQVMGYFENPDRNRPDYKASLFQDPVGGEEPSRNYVKQDHEN